MNKEELLSSEKKIDSDKTKCPNCGGNSEFNPKLQKLQCLYCYSVFDVPKDLNVDEQPLEDLLINGKPWSEAEVIKCSNCGAKEIISKGEIATACSFCGTTSIVKTEEIIGMKPQGVCPFEKTIKDAEVIAKKWAGKKLFAPNAFKKSAEAKKIHGVYSPVFTFDCVTKSKYDGVLAKTEYYTVRGSDGKLETRTRTETFHISGNYDRDFDDLIVQASSNVPQKTLNKLEPFPTQKSVAYNKSFLSGFSANTYSKDGGQCWKECKDQMYTAIRSEVLQKYDHTSVMRYNQDTNYFNAKYKYVLLPLYVGHHIYKTKVYNFFVNGVTGKIVGKSPVSGWKVTFAVFLFLLVGGVLGFLFFLLAPILGPILENLGN